MGVRVEDEKRRERKRKKRERRENETNKKERGKGGLASAQTFVLFLGPHLSPQGVPSTLPQPLPAPQAFSLTKQVPFYTLHFLSHPTFLVSNLQAPVGGLEA